MSTGTQLSVEQQLEELQRQLMEAQKLGTIGALASSITHEFNNILTTIINSAKFGLRHKDEETRDKYLNKILTAAQRAGRITTGMLSYARNKGDRRDEVDLAQLVEDVLVLVEKDLEVHRVRPQVVVEGQPRAVVNVSQLQQVLLNLVINARQAMPEGGRLNITLRATSEGWAEIEVRDTGAGIPAEHLQRIFDRCFSTKTADSQGQGGSGLGLALAREVIESHQGRIRVASAVGKGTTFTLKLPLVGAAPPVQTAPVAVAVPVPAAAPASSPALPTSSRRSATVRKPTAK